MFLEGQVLPRQNLFASQGDVDLRVRHRVVGPEGPAEGVFPRQVLGGGGGDGAVTDPGVDAVEPLPAATVQSVGAFGMD